LSREKKLKGGGAKLKNLASIYKKCRGRGKNRKFSLILEKM
jgi:hypothetical protein